MKNKISISALFILFSILLCSCGYNIGPHGNPQLKSIAIAPVKNETYEINMGAYMKQALVDRFQFDGTYKITNMSEADAILYGKITGIDVTAANILVAPGGVTFATQEFGVTVNFTYTLIIPGRGQPVIGSTEVSGSAQFQVPVDLFPARAEGVQQACRDVAQQVVWRCSEGW